MPKYKARDIIFADGKNLEDVMKELREKPKAKPAAKKTASTKKGA